MCRPISGPIHEQAEWVLGEAMAESHGDVPTKEEIESEIEWWIADDDKNAVRDEVNKIVAKSQSKDSECDVDAIAMDVLSWFTDFDDLTGENLTDSIKECLRDKGMSNKHVDAIENKFGEHVINAIQMYLKVNETPTLSDEDRNWIKKKFGLQIKRSLTNE